MVNTDHKSEVSHQNRQKSLPGLPSSMKQSRYHATVLRFCFIYIHCREGLLSKHMQNSHAVPDQALLNKVIGCCISVS